MIGRIFSFLITLLVAFTAFVTPALASQDLEQNPPSFPACSSASGEVLASYPDGVHGIAGGGSQEGSDTVYVLNDAQVLQCLCSGNSGVQTNWWKITDFSQVEDLEKQGWVYVPDGESWGLDKAAYMAYNLYGSCGGGGNPGNPNNPNNPGNPQPPVCNDTAPASAPVITSAVVNGDNSVTLTWTPAAEPVTYYLIAYGTEPGNYIWGNPNVGKVTSYTITGLSGGTTYYFVVRAGNGCKPGPFSNEVSSTPTGGQVEGGAEGFSLGVLGATTSAAQTFANSIVNSVCQKCFWWPILLGEIVVLLLFYILMRRRAIRLNMWAVGAVVGIVAYIIFILVNGGKCPDGVMDFRIFAIPCKFFWAVDGVFYVLITWFMRKRKNKAGKKETPKKKRK